jgi:hypothetical protein
VRGAGEDLSVGRRVLSGTRVRRLKHARRAAGTRVLAGGYVICGTETGRACLGTKVECMMMAELVAVLERDGCGG